MPEFALRTHADLEEVNLLCAYLADDTYLYCRENASRAHQHWYISTQREAPAIRKFLRDKLHLTGNKDYSLKTCVDKIKYLAYIIKDGDYINSGVSDEDIASAIEYDKLVKTDILATKTTKKTLKEKFLDWLGGQITNIENPVGYATHVSRFYVETERKFKKFEYEALVEDLCFHRWKWCRDYYELQCINRLPDRTQLEFDRKRAMNMAPKGELIFSKK